MNEDYCKTCTHYYQHYIMDRRSITWVYCGHCTFGKVRSKCPDAKACKNYVPSDSDESAFVTKEYLSKELLRYFLSLDILPEIKNIDDQSKKVGNGS